MRISDWSSDVSSSDLSGPSCPNPPFGRRRIKIKKGSVSYRYQRGQAGLYIRVKWLEPLLTDFRSLFMALVSMRQLHDHAAENGYGIPAFNVNNLEQAIGRASCRERVCQYV